MRNKLIKYSMIGLIFFDMAFIQILFLLKTNDVKTFVDGFLMFDAGLIGLLFVCFLLPKIIVNEGEKNGLNPNN